MMVYQNKTLENIEFSGVFICLQAYNLKSSMQLLCNSGIVFMVAGEHAVEFIGGFLHLSFGEVGVDIHGGSDIGMTDELHGLIRVEAIFPAHGDIVMSQSVGRDDGRIL